MNIFPIFPAKNIVFQELNKKISFHLEIFKGLLLNYF